MAQDFLLNIPTWSETLYYIFPRSQRLSVINSHLLKDSGLHIPTWTMTFQYIFSYGPMLSIILSHMADDFRFTFTSEPGWNSMFSVRAATQSSVFLWSRALIDSIHLERSDKTPECLLSAFFVFDLLAGPGTSRSGTQERFIEYEIRVSWD